MKNFTDKFTDRVKKEVEESSKERETVAELTSIQTAVDAFDNLFPAPDADYDELEEFMQGITPEIERRMQIIASCMEEYSHHLNAVKEEYFRQKSNIEPKDDSFDDDAADRLHELQNEK